MSRIEIELPDEAGNVISLTAVRESMWARALMKKCSHRRVVVDASLATVHCNDCNQDINATEYLSLLIEEWARVKRVTDQYRDAADRLENKSRCKCDHCGKMTKVRPRPREVK